MRVMRYFIKEFISLSLWHAAEHELLGNQSGVALQPTSQSHTCGSWTPEGSTSLTGSSQGYWRDDPLSILQRQQVQPAQPHPQVSLIPAASQATCPQDSKAKFCLCWPGREALNCLWHPRWGNAGMRRRGNQGLLFWGNKKHPLQVSGFSYCRLQIGLFFNSAFKCFFSQCDLLFFYF